MRKRNNLIIIVAAIMLVSFAVAPPANAIIATATLSVILAITMASAIAVNETVKNSDTEKESEPIASEQSTQEPLQASSQP